MVRYLAGTLPAAALISLNNFAKTGSAFKIGYGANVNFPEISTSGTFGFARPDLAAMPALLWGEYRGLFFWCVGLLIAVPGIVHLFRKDRAIAVMVLSTFVLVLLQNAAFFTPFGGNAIGPRYMFPALPFLGLAAAYGIHRWPEPGLVLTVISIVVMGMVTAIAIDPPGDVLEPLQSFYLVRIEQDRFADNLGTLAGLPLSLSLMVPLVVPALAAWKVLKRPQP
jgi:hypothetical protein